MILYPFSVLIELASRDAVELVSQNYGASVYCIFYSLSLLLLRDIVAMDILEMQVI